MSKAIYAFSGDPITFGHLDIIERAAKVFDELVVAIGINPVKKYLFTTEERTELALAATTHLHNVQVVNFRGLLVDYAYENNIYTIIRGLRNGEDFNFELLFHQIGESQRMEIDTFFVPTRKDLCHVSSSAVKALQMEQGLIHEYVPLNVKQKLEERLSGQFIVGVTGEIGAGKTYFCRQLIEAGMKEGIEVHHIEVDKIGHALLETLTEPLFVKLREQIAATFGKQLLTEEGFIKKDKLGELIFSDLEKLEKFNQLIYQPMLLRLRRALYGKKGILLLDSALIAESRMTYLSNNNMILVRTSPELQVQRLTTRNYSPEQMERRMKSQYTYERKRDFVEEEINKKGHGKLFLLENENGYDHSALKNILESILHPEKQTIYKKNQDRNFANPKKIYFRILL